MKKFLEDQVNYSFCSPSMGWLISLSLSDRDKKVFEKVDDDDPRISQFELTNFDVKDDLCESKLFEIFKEKADDVEIIIATTSFKKYKKPGGHNHHGPY